MAKSKFSRNRQSWNKNVKTIHNQKKPFNPEQYGKVWNSIGFKHEWGRVPQGETKGPIIGKLVVGSTQVELTFTETNKIIETLQDAQHAHNVGVRMGKTNSDAGISVI